VFTTKEPFWALKTCEDDATMRTFSALTRQHLRAIGLEPETCRCVGVIPASLFLRAVQLNDNLSRCDSP
jgi:hypothetical protein